MPKTKKTVIFTKRFWIIFIILCVCVVAKCFYSCHWPLANNSSAVFAPQDTEEPYEVDLVYLWCDGNEPQFKERKDYWLAREKNEPAPQATAAGRFEQVDELKYSLRSVEQYLPWIHHIYIITDRQVPPWLNTAHPQLTVVDHSQIIPSQYIPVFNSNAIETSVYKIPGLAEHFLLANDDTFVNRPLTRSFFFEKGKPWVRVTSNNLFDATSLYRIQLLNAIELTEQAFNAEIPLLSQRNWGPHHNIDSYLKSDYAACAQHFKKQYEQTLTHRFRQADDVQRFIVSIWAVMKGHAQVRIVFPFETNTDSLVIVNREEKYADILARFRPGLFCLNDGELSTVEDRMRVKAFLQKYFPNKSKFEL